MPDPENDYWLKRYIAQQDERFGRFESFMNDSFASFKEDIKRLHDKVDTNKTEADGKIGVVKGDVSKVAGDLLFEKGRLVAWIAVFSIVFSAAVSTVFSYFKK